MNEKRGFCIPIIIEFNTIIDLYRTFNHVSQVIGDFDKLSLKYPYGECIKIIYGLKPLIWLTLFQLI